MSRGRLPTCPYCQAASSIRKGYRRTKEMGVRQIRHCKACKRRFTPKQQNSPKEPGGDSNWTNEEASIVGP
jgi:hypothetical protein